MMGKKRKLLEQPVEDERRPRPAEGTLPKIKSTSNENGPIDSHRIEILRTKFGSLENALSDLLLESSSEAELRMAVGSEEKFNFMQALKSLYQSGDMKWLARDEKSKKSEATAPPTSLSFPGSSPPSKKWPPQLPQINNKAIETQVFTHASFIGGDGNGLGDEQKHYQRLEFLGDAALNFITTNILYHRFPTSREGQLSLIRQEFVSNKNLYTYSLLYNFHNRVRLGKDAIQQDVKWGVKYAADIFEAYIGGLVADRPGLEGQQVVDEFLRELFEPQLIQQVGVARDRLPPANKQARHELWNLVGGNPAAKLRYEWTGGEGGSEGGFWFTVYFTGYDRYTGLLLGSGYGQNKQDAQLRAAMNALKNKLLIEEIKKTKDEFLAVKKRPTSAYSTPFLQTPPPALLGLHSTSNSPAVFSETPPVLPPSPGPPTPISSSSQNSNPPKPPPSSTSLSAPLDPRAERGQKDTSLFWTQNAFK